MISIYTRSILRLVWSQNPPSVQFPPPHQNGRSEVESWHFSLNGRKGESSEWKGKCHHALNLLGRSNSWDQSEFNFLLCKMSFLTSPPTHPPGPLLLGVNSSGGISGTSSLGQIFRILLITGEILGNSFQLGSSQNTNSVPSESLWFDKLWYTFMMEKVRSHLLQSELFLDSPISVLNGYKL